MRGVVLIRQTALQAIAIAPRIAKFGNPAANPVHTSRKQGPPNCQISPSKHG